MSLDRLRSGAGRRTVAVGLAVLIETLLLVMLLSFGVEPAPGKKERPVTVLEFKGEKTPEEVDEPETPPSERQAEERAPPQRPPEEEKRPAEPAPAVPAPAVPAQPAPPPPRIAVPTPEPRPPAAAVPRPPAPPAPAQRRVYGPPNKGAPSFMRDTERVGTAPNGEPLYAAAWYREPEPAALRAYLSTARGPGWGLIACRTAPNYRVEDCVPLDEYPQGSQINRSILAAAWEFKVRPPRRGGRELVGSWVRIRIDYGIERRK